MIPEAALAAAVASWLESEGWEIYREVSLEWQLRSRHAIGDGRADLVGLRAGYPHALSPQLCVVEVKATLSWELFSQAARWRDYTHITWIAVPHAKMSEGRHEAFQIAKQHYGFGVLEVENDIVYTKRAPAVREAIDPALLTSLRPEHKTHAESGTNRGGQWTSFKETGAALAKYVAEHPGCKLAEAVEAITHHYRHKASAVSSLAKEIKKGRVPGVHVGWRQGLYSTEEAARTGGAAT